MAKYDEGYLDDLADLLNSLESNFLQLENKFDNQELLEQSFRDLHTIKGAAYMYNLKQYGDFVHNFENIYDDIRNKKYQLSSDIIKLSLDCIDFLRTALQDSRFEEEHTSTTAIQLLNSLNVITNDLTISGNKSEVYVGPSIYLLVIEPKITLKANDGHPLHYIIADLKEYPNQEFLSFKKRPKGAISKWKLLFQSSQKKEEIESLFLFVEEDLKIQLEEFKIEDKRKLDEPMKRFLPLMEEKSGQHLVKDLKLALCGIKKTSTPTTKKGEIQPKEKSDSLKEKIKQTSYLKVSQDKIDDLMSWVSELITMQATLKEEANKFQSETLFRVSENMEFISENLRETIFSISLVPISRLETRFKRLIHDLSRELNKKVDLKTNGAETELDKKIIESLTDPLLHILRNCIDHGIETPTERKKNGKAEEGTIIVDSYYSGNHVIIEITDDGKGIDTQKVKKKAIERGIIGKDDNLKDDELHYLIFHPGFSTAEKISDVSGRGVGMDVVRKKIQEIRGEVILDSEFGKGTKITIKIPLSLSIIDGLLTKVGHNYFVLPLNTVREIHRISKSQFEKLPHASNILEIEGKQMPVISLEKTFNMGPSNGSQYLQNQTADIISADIGITKKGIAVDSIVGQVKAVLKPLSEYYKNQEFISGGTILGNGKLALILDIDKLIMKN